MTKREVIFEGTAPAGVPARVSWKEDEHVGVPQIGDSLPQIRQSLLYFVLIERAEGAGISTVSGSVPLLHARKQDDSHSKAFLVRQADRTRHLLVVVGQKVRARAKARFAKFQIVVAAGFVEVVHSRVLGRRIRGKCALQTDSLEATRMICRALRLSCGARGILKQK